MPAIEKGPYLFGFAEAARVGRELSPLLLNKNDGHRCAMPKKKIFTSSRDKQRVDVLTLKTAYFESFRLHAKVSQNVGR